MKYVGVPFSGGSLGKNVGCSEGCFAIAEKLSVTLDLVPVVSHNFEKTHENIRSFSFPAGSVVLGGDHSISYSVLESFCSDKDDVGLIVFDAHGDCMQSFSPVTHENFLRMVVEKGLVTSVLLVGVRVLDPVEKEFLDSCSSIKYVMMKDCDLHHLRNVFSSFVGFHSYTYVSFDIDVLDPSVAPGTGYLEEDGVSLSFALACVEYLSSLGVSLWDLVEVNPSLDVEGKTVSSACALVRMMR